MKILQVGKYYSPARGGIETFLLNLSEGLTAKGHEITVLCSNETRRSAAEIIGGVQVIRTPRYGTLLSQPLNLALPLTLRRLAQNADLVHIHMPNPLVESLSLMLPSRIPIVATYHSDIVRQKMILPFYMPILRRFLLRTKKIIVATQSHVTHSPALQEFQDQCAIIPYGLNPRSFERNPSIDSHIQKIRAKYGRFVLFVGRLVGYKGVSVLLDAFKNIQAPLVIIGDGPLRDSLKQQAQDLGISDRVHFLGQISDPDEFVAHYHSCELFVLPSVTRNEAFGLVQLEAMACSKPSVITKLPSGITEVNIDGVTGVYVQPNDRAQLADAIRDLLEDPVKRLKMGEASRKRFEALFTQHKMIESYEKLYEEVCSR